MADNAGMNNEPESSDSLKTFGAIVKVFRERAGYTQEQLAPLLRYSVQTQASIEQGRRFPQREYVDRAEDVLDAFGVLRAAAKCLVRKPGLAAWFKQWAALEEQAISLCTYECRLIPGLLQNEVYGQAVFHSTVPPLTDDEIVTRLAARRERQRLLWDRPNTAFSFIFEQALLNRHTGGTEVTKALIDHLLECAELRNVEIQIIPLVQETHSALEGPMQLLETPDNQWFGYLEGQRSGQLITDPKEVSVLQMRYAKLRSQALTPEDSVSLLRQIRGAL
ncbi:xre family toxin-antitoxin system, antitoxin component [Streptomyces himastatinicus ATCC 53653]|uniref:Xre family toxin-antitoxin system, antitoxin component n=1 Tax=Streptomyces himastatinicus ATCC 53653 TaxID=457427 RepID=D9WQW2_9ACTN|nr:helix-turn-helix transcriptional regulator [Streptomyces himastatinicus]EFL21939.1 xre family toxin-antitoxin system, antitoxin component [Streptomyces himastatinicus ATCC 53653]